MSRAKQADCRPVAHAAAGLPSPERTSATQAGRDYGAAIWFVAALLPILLAGLLENGSGRRVILPWVGVPLPETCMMRIQFGIDCPGCGLTRAFVNVVQGNPAGAYAIHPLSLVIFAFTLVQLPLALVYWSAAEHPLVSLATRCNRNCMLGLAALLLVRWLWLLASGGLWPV
jgi:hypothetical protein